MFWNVLHQSGTFYPTIIPLVIPTTTTIPIVSPTIPSVPEEPQQPRKIKTPLLALTQKDLKKAGYENKKRPWTEEEDQKLKHLRDTQKLDWPDISDEIQGRNPKMCYNRYRRLENHTKNLWRRVQNQKLRKLVDEIGENWKQLSMHFQGRTHKQIKEHYINFLRPQIKKDDWTLFLNVYGKNWKYLERNFEGRTQNQIKNRYFGRLKKIGEKKLSIGEESEGVDEDSAQEK